jgi:hypothetical protein
MAQRAGRSFDAATVVDDRNAADRKLDAARLAEFLAERLPVPGMAADLVIDVHGGQRQLEFGAQSVQRVNQHYGIHSTAQAYAHALSAHGVSDQQAGYVLEDAVCHRVREIRWPQTRYPAMAGYRLLPACVRMGLSEPPIP